MLQSFRNLTQREQVLIVGLGALVSVLVLIYMVVLPIFNFESDRARQYANAARLVALTDGLEAPGVESADDRALRTVVTELADRRGIVYTRINQTTEGGLQLDLEGVPYGSFFAWLQQLEREQDIIVSAAFVAPGEAADTVEGRITLLRAN